MDKEFVFSEHALVRIGERMKLNPKQVGRKIIEGLMVEVATAASVESHKYGVLWDPVAQKPFLLVFRAEEGKWSLLTVYETFPYHSRMDNVVIKSYHINGARTLSVDYSRNLIESKRKAKRSVVFLDLIVRHLNLGGKPTSRRYALGKVGIEDYETRLRSNAKLLLEDLLRPETLDKVEVPKDSLIYYEAYRKTETGKLIVGGGQFE